MFKKLQQKWNIGPWQLFLVLCTFAIGGSLTGYMGRWILSHFQINHTVLYTISYIIIMTMIWPLMVSLVSIPLGQFKFFKAYLGQLWRKIKSNKTQKK